MCIFFIQWFNDLWLLWAWTWKWIYWSSGIGPTRLLVKLIILMQMSTPFNSPPVSIAMVKLLWSNDDDPDQNDDDHGQSAVISMQNCCCGLEYWWQLAPSPVGCIIDNQSKLSSSLSSLLTINQNYHHHHCPIKLSSSLSSSFSSSKVKGSLSKAQV